MTATFLGADKHFEEWAAFGQHIECPAFNHDKYYLIVYKREDELSETEVKELKEKLTTVSEEVQGAVKVFPSVYDFLKSLAMYLN